MKPQGKNAQETKKRNNEIISNLKQTLSKPTIVEAQRTLKILEKLIERVAVFTSLDSDFVIKFNEINNPQKFRLNKTLIQELQPDVLEALVREARLESEFRLFAGLEQQLKDNEIVEEEKLREYERVKKDLAYSFKSLVRALEHHPGDIEVLKSLKMNSAPNVEVGNIHEALSNYKIIMQKTLATAAEEDESHTRLIEELQMKIESLEKTKNNCDQELRRLREDRSKHAEDKKDEMDKLRSQIKEVKSNKEREMEQIARSLREQSEALAREYKKEEDNFRTLIAQERTKLAKMREENSKAEVKSKSDKLTSESHLSDLIQAYDADMSKLHAARSNAQKELKRLSD